MMREQYVDNSNDDGSSSCADSECTSSNNSVNSSANNKNTTENLVRRENAGIVVVRSMVIIIAFGATALTAWFLYALAERAERQSFLADFTSSAEALVENFVSEIATRFFMASTLSVAITSIMEAANNVDRINVTFPGDRWSVLTQEMRFRGYSTLVTYAPIVTDNDSRERLEDKVAAETAPLGVAPCFTCDSIDQYPLNPESILEIPTVASFSCYDVWKGGLEGVIPEDSCAFVVMLYKPKCGCVVAPEIERERAMGFIQREGGSDLPKVMYTVQMNRTSNEAEIVPLLGNENDATTFHLPIAASTVQNSLMPILFDIATHEEQKFTYDRVAESQLTVISPFHMRDNPFHRYFDPPNEQDELGYSVLSPVFNVGDNSEIIGVVSCDYRFQTFFRDAIPYSTTLLLVQLENTCGQTESTVPFNLRSGFYGLRVPDELPELVEGAEDLAIFSTYEAFEEIVNIASIKPSLKSNGMYCRYRIKILPTKALEDEFITNRPYYYAITSVVMFLFTACLFVLYDVLVTRRQTIIVDAANKTNDIVESLFPSNVRDRLLEGVTSEDGPNAKQTFKKSLNTFLVTGDASKFVTGGAIADLFPHVTVMFFDIEGFTQWSSERQPSQVYMLLEALYGAFDLYATRMKIFKVETVGDCYMAACGLPQENHRHAIVLAKFAKICLARMKIITRKLEAFLGPSTGDLRARIGLNSGPVTAGILRGDKARYQLFGDTVNTAARLEHLGEPMRIQCSSATANLLETAGYSEWVTQREGLLHVKGKGGMQTYWVHPTSTGSASVVSGNSSELDDEDDELGEFLNEEERITFKENKLRQQRLVAWNVEILYGLLKKIAAHRQQYGVQDDRGDISEFLSSRPRPIEELTQVITFPSFQGVAPQSEGEPLLEAVKPQLQNFVREISQFYREVPFHNFSHASHVVMSASKLMKRIVDPNGVMETTGQPMDSSTAKDIHDATYGLSSDPLMQFSVVFSALIHDVDHTGLTNGELMDMKANVAAEFENKSIAEQNSIVLAWSTLIKDEYKELRTCIFATENERRRFRQYIVNAVIATDIGDKNLKALRESRWDAAFASDSTQEGESNELSPLDANRRATVIFEYIIQAADISHCMQHWKTYQRFNERLFEERYVAWISGKAEKEPSDGWYGGELWFFDNYIIPLAQKLKKCGVFGVSYYEFLEYAQSNRLEWQQKGKEIVPKLLEQCQEKYGSERESYRSLIKKNHALSGRIVV